MGLLYLFSITMHRCRSLNKVALILLQFHDVMNVVVIDRREVNILGVIQLHKSSYHFWKNHSPISKFKIIEKIDKLTDLTSSNFFHSRRIYFYFYCVISKRFIKISDSSSMYIVQCTM
jgi:hypothetical protein